jgi:endonuclease G, mitochondrial
MIEVPSLRPETRYGMPNADLLLFNRHYIIGYSFLMRQPRWAMEVIDPNTSPIGAVRADSFRPDFRVPEQWRVDLEDYVKSGYDRGHLISSADRLATDIANSETFLMSNMAPQKAGFNRGIWKELEMAVRSLAARDEILEVYTICGPLFHFKKEVEKLGEDVAVPHGFFKSVLAEDRRGALKLWTFAIANAASPSKPLQEMLKPTTDVEAWSGLPLWDRLRGIHVDRMKRNKGRMWAH